MTQPTPGAGGPGDGGISGRLGSAWRGDGSREPGSRRARLLGLVSSVKEVYQTNYASLGNTFREMDDYDGGVAEAYPDATITRSGTEEMILFPSYARHHTKQKKGGEHDPNATDENENANGDGAQAIHQHWDKFEDQHAIVDVDIRGWVYSPHRGPMNRKQRLAIGIARQLAGLPSSAGTVSPLSNSPQNSRSTSPHPLRQRMEEHSNRKEQQLVDLETDSLLSKAEAEAERADRGEYSEFGPSSSLANRQRADDLRKFATKNAAEDRDEPKITMLQKRASWNQPDAMSKEELTAAHNNLMTRLRPFYANPLENAPVSAFFYNNKDSRQRTIYTNSYGHFALRAALDFIPTHVRVLASEHLSATEEVKIAENNGISVISDIDDTIKHTAMTSGAREAFRNAFLRDLNDLVIDGVQDWYCKLADMGVSFHYVSNSPWQLFPVLSRFFGSVGLPPGSFHLKQYSGMLQGIFEPVAERKKSTLDRIARDFPDRYFILVGDSGEADLEVYVDFVQENPGRVLGVFIRDVTTPISHGFFDSNSSLRSSSGASTPRNSSQQNLASVPEEDAELKAAIEASLKEFEADEVRRRGRAPTYHPKDSPSQNRSSSGDLISFDSDDDSDKTSRDQSRGQSNPNALKVTTSGKRPPPPPPKKPESLRAPSSRSVETTSNNQMPRKPALPPRQSDSSISESLPSRVNSSQQNEHEADSYPAAAKQKIASVYNSLPSAPWSASQHAGEQQEDRRLPSNASDSSQPPALPRRGITAYPAAAAQYATSYFGGAQSPHGTPGLTGAPSSGAIAAMTKAQTNRIELWKRRWADAERTLSKKGVFLKSWRVGSDAMEDCVKLVDRGKRMIENEKRKGNDGDDQ